MPIEVTPLHPTFMGEVADIDLRDTHDPGTLGDIRSEMDRYGVLVFRDQRFNDDEHLAFAKRLDGVIHAKTGARVVKKSRLGNEALTDISNLDENEQLLDGADRRRHYSLANRLWHTDASFENPPGRYSMLYAYVIPPVPADTQFADMRSAYDALPEAMKSRLNGLIVHHSIAYSRQTLGFEFSQAEAAQLVGAKHPLVRNLANGRRSLYLASHASSIDGLELPDARLLIKDLMEHATQPKFVYSHAWRERDLVIWDNRATMHRAVAFDDQRYKRELRRVTTLDVDEIGVQP